MSKPPRPAPAQGRARPLAQLGFHGFVELQRELAARELGLVTRDDEADDPATSLFSLAALVGHVLARHQDLHEREASPSRARLPRSLIDHGRQLGWRPDPGLSATGVVAFELREGLAGELPAGLALLSGALGSSPATPFETSERRRLDAALNRVVPCAALEPRRYPSSARELELVGRNLQLCEGDPVVLAHADDARAKHVSTIVAIREQRHSTTLVLSQQLGTAIDDARRWRLYAKPLEKLALFGRDVASPSARGKITGTALEAGGVDEGWRRSSPAQLQGDEVLVSGALSRSLVGEPLALYANGRLRPLAVVEDSERLVVASLVREQDGQVLDTIDSPTTLMRLVDEQGRAIARSELDLSSTLLSRWSRSFALVGEAPSLAPVREGEELLLPGRLPLAVGMLALLRTRTLPRRALLIEIESVGWDAEVTRISWRRRSELEHSFVRGDVELLGNIVAVVHGERVDERLPESDGVTPRLRATLSRGPVGHLRGPDGARPTLSVRVGAVTWTRVPDFSRSGPEDRHYVTMLDDQQRLQVCFGDGQRGAIPAAGSEIRASYRVGVGRAGELGPGRIDRLRSAHPWIAAVHNPLPTQGGEDPSAGEELRHQATRGVRSFGRAVSVDDHADLALTYPGVVRARASWVNDTVLLTVGDRWGRAPSDRAALLSYLQARREQRVPLRIQGPQAVALHLHVELRLRAGHEPSNVEAAVRAALLGDEPEQPGMFAFLARELGEPAYLSQVYACIDAIAGVESVRVRRFELAASPQVSDRLTIATHERLTIATHEWLSLPASNLRVDIATQQGGVP